MVTGPVVACYPSHVASVPVASAQRSRAVTASLDFQDMLSFFSRQAALAGFVSISLGASSLAAQTSERAGAGPAMTRLQLEQRARAADSLGRHEESFVLRTRLREGDFSIGDVVIIDHEGPSITRRDSLVVGAGKTLHLSSPLGELSLQGMLRYELADSVRGRVDKYFKDQSVRVMPLVRLSISGAARSPGFYQFRTDAPLTDVVMRGGGVQSQGQTQTSTLDNIVIKRGEQIIWGAQDVQSALTNGMTVLALDLQAGDDIVFGQAPGVHWKTFAPYVGSVLTGLLLFIIQRAR
jgi:hypothetical protein